MSALADSRVQAGSRPPAYGSLLLATLSAQIMTGLALWVVQLPFALIGIAPISAAQSLWLPWGVGGWWSALGLAAYVLIVSVVGGSMVARRVEYRGIARPAPAWIWLAFGASGYGAELLGRSGGARLVLAVVLAPLTVRLFAYRVDGSRRGWPSRLSLGRRLLSAGLLGAAVLALSYSTTHAFAQDGSAGASSPTLWPGQAMVLDVGLQGIALPSQPR
jgi:hypothetical protein